MTNAQNKFSDTTPTIIGQRPSVTFRSLARINVTSTIWRMFAFLLWTALFSLPGRWSPDLYEQQSQQDGCHGSCIVWKCTYFVNLCSHHGWTKTLVQSNTRNIHNPRKFRSEITSNVNHVWSKPSQQRGMCWKTNVPRNQLIFSLDLMWKVFKLREWFAFPIYVFDWCFTLF